MTEPVHAMTRHPASAPLPWHAGEVGAAARCRPMLPGSVTQHVPAEGACDVLVSTARETPG